MMINNDNEYSTNTVTNQSKTISSQENNSTMSPPGQSSNANGEQQQQQSVHNSNNDLNQNESQEIVADTEAKETDDNNEDDDEFIRITAAHQMLTEAQIFDEKKDYPSALHLYRICVDLLLEELMFTEGTEQSRIYLREKCTAIMDRIDLLKTMLDPILPIPSPPTPPPPPPPPPPSTTTTTTSDE